LGGSRSANSVIVTHLEARNFDLCVHMLAIIEG